MTSAIGTTWHDQQQPSDVLVGPQWLAAHLDDPELRVVEVDVSAEAYTAGHIEGAALWNVYRDLKDAEYRTVDRSSVEKLLSSSGISQQSTVVFYGYAPALGFWLLKLYGHQDVRILDCGRKSWVDAGLPWTTAVQGMERTQYLLPDRMAPIRADRPTVLAAIADPDSAILDVRGDLEFRGERFWPSGGQEPGGRAGHIPSAVNLSVDGILDEWGSFRSGTQLHSMFEPIDGRQAEVITYCTIGGRASTVWFVLTYLLGRKNVRVYDGSWAEWGRLPTSPVSTEMNSGGINSSASIEPV